MCQIKAMTVIGRKMAGMISERMDSPNNTMPNPAKNAPVPASGMTPPRMAPIIRHPTPFFAVPASSI